MEKKINLGCGPKGHDDWINVDWGILAIMHRFRPFEKVLLKLNLFPEGFNVNWPKNLKLHNCKKGLPYQNDSIDYIYSSHFLEHLKKFQAEKIIVECQRVLKPGGVLRISVPDLELLATKYVQKDAAYFDNIEEIITSKNGNSATLLGDVLVSNFYPQHFKNKPTFSARVMNIFARPHLWMFDYESLQELLSKHGFRNIEKKTFQDGRVPNIDFLDGFPEMSLFVEAEK